MTKEISKFTKSGYITDINIVSNFAAIHLKLSAAQQIILNLYIVNWLANRLEPLEKNNPANQLFKFPVTHFANYYRCKKLYLIRNLNALKIPITCMDGIKKQIMFGSSKCKSTWIGMELSIIHQLVNTDVYNKQCDFHNRPELKIHNFQSYYHDNNPFKESEEMTPIFLIENKTETETESRNHSEWSESLVKKICLMAIEKNAQILKSGKYVNVFPHLVNGEFRKDKRNGIDSACKLIDDLYSGQFFRLYRRHELFGNINENFLQFKNVDSAFEKILFLSKEKNKIGIEKFIMKCAGHYFEALKPGNETYRDIKAHFPTTIKNFILFQDRTGNYIANFLLYYYSTLSTKDMEIFLAMKKITKLVPEKILKKLYDYEDYVSENQIQSFWINIRKLVHEINLIIKKELTSYSMDSCYEMVFNEVEKNYNQFKTILPGYFDPENQTVRKALIIIKDK